EIVGVQLSACRSRAAAEQRFDAGLEFRCLKWLRQVIVAACFKTLHLIIQFTARRQHENRCVDSVFSKTPADLESVAGWKHDVEDDEIEWIFCCKFLAFDAVIGTFHQITIAPEQIRQSAAEVRFILDEKYSSVIH